MNQPSKPIEIFHIVHKDRLASIMTDGFLWSDAKANQRGCAGTTIGMTAIKERRLTNPLSSCPGLCVGQCVPFYFCPRSIMLYLLHRGNHPDVTYRGGQTPIVHLVSDMHTATAWAEKKKLRWAFTLSNAGSRYFEDRSDLAALDEINWNAVGADIWSGANVSSEIKQGKQAEFLVEERFSWSLVEEIGVHTPAMGQEVHRLLNGQTHRPAVTVVPRWYY